MKKSLVLFTLGLLALPLFSQAPYPDADDGRLLLASTTCVVLESDPFSEFNPAIREAMKDFWTITPYEFINLNEFGKRRQDAAYSFIVLLETEYERDRTGSVFAFLNFLLGKKGKSLNDLPEFCAVPLDFGGDEADAEYEYKLGLLLRFIQQHAGLVIENPRKPGLRDLKSYNQMVPEIAGKTILARAEDMEPSLREEDALAEIYTQPFKIVDEDEIMKAIAEKRANTLILHKVGPPVDSELMGAYVFKMLVGTDDARMYYFNTHKTDQRNPNGFLPSDLRRLARF